jgi:hypothetical protein
MYSHSLIKAIDMMVLNYATKKDLKAAVGQSLKYTETSMFGAEYKETGKFVGCNRPHLTGYKREFFAEVIMENGKIKAVK